ncbi:hypothetical protein H257_18063 [Aphanomyces astaci]|uniref:Retroviral polymerase SH3-like domain-containing protein n=1 Tax=Aphanomyces astaci TaxID=112090 RepID=W4FCC4_APHAT|nr:hypothetical protein H257_18063 [Aphanomyces astaci]ETV65137.1 hypothetical protein H257_18063 [Aphanomyces astaci]|eukprot:XP_009845375.1 hypothetical protein H257_18063 [Aphanomyces astaci]
MPTRGQAGWARTAAFLPNRTLNVNTDGKTPYKLIHGAMPNSANLKSYATNHKAYKLYDLETKMVVIAVDVRFFENEFPNCHVPIMEASTDAVEADFDRDGLETHDTAARHAPRAPMKAVPETALYRNPASPPTTAPVAQP